MLGCSEKLRNNQDIDFAVLKVGLRMGPNGAQVELDVRRFFGCALDDFAEKHVHHVVRSSMMSLRVAVLGSNVGFVVVIAWT